jgi:site-specific DNA-methyltransferase (adenine-specific)
MSTDAICKIPVASFAKKKSVLLLWATWKMMPEALRVIEAWGFRYVTGLFVWVKINKRGTPVCGMGRYSKTSTEFVLLADRGGATRVADLAVNQVFHAERIRSPKGEKHSAKPLEVYNLIDRLYPTASKLELFARKRQPGWTSYGLDLGTELGPWGVRAVAAPKTELAAGRDQFGNRVGSVPSIVTELLQERSGHTWTAKEMVEAVTKVLVARGLPPLSDPRHVVTVLGLLKTNKKPPLVEQPGRGLFRATKACLAGMA